MRFLLVPIAVVAFEIWLMITVGAEIGALPAVALIVLTAAVGLALIRRQGADTLWRFQRRMELGELPAQEMLEGMMLAIAGVLLVVPGFATDLLGFALLVPPLRMLMMRRALTNFVQQQQRYRAQRGEEIIEGEFSRDDHHKHLK